MEREYHSAQWALCHKNMKLLPGERCGEAPNAEPDEEDARRAGEAKAVAAKASRTAKAAAKAKAKADAAEAHRVGEVDAKAKAAAAKAKADAAKAAKPTGGGAPGPVKYPIGLAVTPAEAKSALTHAPRDAQGKAFCWGYMTHQGCPNAAACKAAGRAHSMPAAALTSGLKAFHHTVAMQLLRRGGLKEFAGVARKALTEVQVDGLVKTLRDKAKKEHADKINGPAARGHPRRGMPARRGPASRQM
jgi:hypothetical protein